jgi:signal transduction histidine kinase
LAALGRSFNIMTETLQKTQTELQHKERLASAGQLAAGVAHEINNPLGSILLSADILYRETDPEDPKRADSKLISDRTIRCKNIVADLLNFARQQEVPAEKVDLKSLIYTAIETASVSPSYEGVDIAFNFSP